ncbi:ectoine/hydroxyectoine ABC transporter ATP-binding protein EhuA, partial [Pantoea dispersa]|nr:ectoine/hydroxyectoine ABC transporter ATP-binding protein EhuA [Pantoea dispersa]
GYALERGLLHRLSARKIYQQGQKIGKESQEFNLCPLMPGQQEIREGRMGVHKCPRDGGLEHARARLATVGLGDKGEGWPR